LQAEARELNAPVLEAAHEGRPWVIAKWAMTLDGKIATRTGDSQWISNAAARGIVHQLRGRMDGIMIGRGTALADDPRLTARPTGVRRATRVVCDSRAQLPLESQLVRSAEKTPVLVAVGADAPAERCDQLRTAGCEVLSLPAQDHVERLRELLLEFGRRRWTNVLVEGGGGLLGALFDGQMIDEVHAFIAPKLLGGSGPSVLGGVGVETIAQAACLFPIQIEQLEDNVYLHGRVSARNS
jgi:diaminohydroxyphosphoribosylaminopyrimidine deaminase / 5-amino-6-(5-phosphoribosylamino)uracil reductase